MRNVCGRKGGRDRWVRRLADERVELHVGCYD